MIRCRQKYLLQERKLNTDEKQRTKQGKVGYREVLRQREYFKILLAGLVNRFGDSIDAVAFTWLVYAITGKASWSALVFAANQLPSVLVQPFAGVLVEGMDKKEADGGDGHRARHHDIRTCSTVSDIVRKPLAAAGIYACQFHGGGVSAPGRACSDCQRFWKKDITHWKHRSVRH